MSAIATAILFIGVLVSSAIDPPSSSRDQETVFGILFVLFFATVVLIFRGEIR